VTHDPAAAAYGDRIVHIRDGLIDSEESPRLAAARAGA
jgi:hypothetical protein